VSSLHTATEEFCGEPIVGRRSKVRCEIKNDISSAKDGAPERPRCGTIKKKTSYILQLMTAGAARRILLPFYPA